MVDLGISKAICIREGDDGPYLVLWSTDTSHGQADSGKYYRVAIEQSPGGWRAFVPARVAWSVEAPARDDAKKRLVSMIAETLRHEEALIARYVEPDPRHPGEGNARIKDAGPSVWAIIGHLEGVQGDTRQTAEDYDLPIEAVEAAHAYYLRHEMALDARRAANRVPRVA
ncbi:MAG: hypothetical protein ACYDAR_07250 [Thermomicrobiales bacterium]